MYHLGTLAFGGFVVGVLCILSCVVAFLGSQFRGKDGMQNKVSQCVLCCCSCCQGAIEAVVRMANTPGYADYVIYGNDYPKACWHVTTMMVHNPAMISLTQAITGIMRWIGTFTLGLFGTWGSYYFTLANGQEMPIHKNDLAVFDVILMTTHCPEELARLRKLGTNHGAYTFHAGDC